jgi:hypothetical protein
MCFLLFAGTTKPIPRKQWNQASPDLCVEPLSERDAPLRAYFSMPEVQYVASTSDCGCDFPHLIFQSGGWPNGPEEGADVAATHRRNQEGLVTILRDTKQDCIELYGIWDGDFSRPKSTEEILIDELLQAGFHFKEQGFL